MKRQHNFTKVALFLSIWILVACQFSMAQTKSSLDSLNQQLAIAKQDTTKALILHDICQYYYNTNIDSAESYAEQALLLAEKESFIYGQALSKKALANILWKNGEHKKALHLFE